jgi:hypothetical protein
MAEDEKDPSYNHDLSALEKLKKAFTNLMSDEAGNDVGDSVNTGSSSDSAAKASVKRMKSAQVKRAKVLKGITRPSMFGRFNPGPNMGDTIETNIDDDGNVTPTGEFSNAMPSNVQRIRQGIFTGGSQSSQGVLNNNRGAQGMLGSVSRMALGGTKAIANTMGGALDFLKKIGGKNGLPGDGGVQDLGKAKPIGDNNADMGKHLVQIWEHMRDTLDDIREMLKDIANGRQGKTSGTAPGDPKQPQGGGSGFWDKLLEALAPALTLIGALLAAKFGGIVVAVTSAAKKFAGMFDEAGKNIEKTLGELGSKFESLKAGIGSFLSSIGDKVKASPVGKAIENAKNALPEAIAGDEGLIAKVGGAAKGAAKVVGRVTGGAATKLTGLGLRGIGGTIGTLAKGVGAGASAVILGESVYHGMGAYHDFQSGNKWGALSNSERAAADIMSAGGPKNVLGGVGDLAKMTHIPGIAQVGSLLTKYGNSSNGKLVNKGLSWGVQQIRNRIVGAGAGAAMGGAGGAAVPVAGETGISEAIGGIGGAVLGFAAPQLISKGLNANADWIDHKYNPATKDKNYKDGGFDKFLTAVGKFADMTEKLVNLPQTLATALVSAISNGLNPAKAVGGVLGNVANAFTGAASAAAALMPHVTAQTVGAHVGTVKAPPQLASANSNGGGLTINFHNSQIQSDDHAKKLIEKAFKAKQQQEDREKRANNRFGNLGLPQQTQSTSLPGFISDPQGGGFG